MAMIEFQPKISSTTPNPLSSDACKNMKSSDFTSSEDLISTLPNEILTHILSFLPTDSSVATSVLSKRWYDIWSLVPNLDFATKGRHIYIFSPNNCPVKIAQFVKFVDRVLFSNNVLSVRKVYLHCFEDLEISRVIDWINAIVRREAEIFDLRLPLRCVVDDDNFDCTSQMYSVPDSFFNQRVLVKLKLENIVLEVPSFVCLPSLETIDFDSVCFINDHNEAMKNLLSGCPVLKSLCIKQGFLLDKKTVNISSTTLRDLKLDNMSYEDAEDFGYNVIIDAPNLMDIELTDEADTIFDIINGSSLVKAILSIRVHYREYSRVYEKRLRGLLRKISHVKELILGTSTIVSFDDLHRPVGFLPVFKNLTLLDVNISDGHWWPVVPRLFHSMPNLVNFRVDMDVIEEVDEDEFESLELPQCLLSTLEIVKIVHGNKDRAEMGLIRYILKHAMVLKRLSIKTVCLDLGEEANVVKELQALPKNSSACQVEYKNKGSCTSAQ